MARIILSPNESFEHYHSHASKTLHIRGNVVISFAGESYRLDEYTSIDVPGETPHTITNMGETEAEVGCVGTGATAQHLA